MHVQPVGSAPVHGDTLRLTGAASTASLDGSNPALLHTLRTRCPSDAAPFLSHVQATYPRGVSKPDAALRLLHPQDEDLEVGEVTIIVEGAGEAPTRPRQTNPCTTAPGRHPHTPSCVRRSPESPTGVLPYHQPHTCPAAGRTRACPPPSPGPGLPTTEGRSSGKSARAPPSSSSSSRPAGTRSGS